MRTSLWFLIVLFLFPSALFAERQTPIYVWFSHHIDDGRVDVTSTRPIRSTAAVRWLMQVYEKHDIKAQLGFVGSVLQLIHLDDPQVTAAIKRLKMPVGYHPGSGHREPCQVGRAVFVPSQGRQDLEARRQNLEILWNFETKTLIPKWRWRSDGGISDDNPQYGQLMPFEELSQYNLPQKESWRFGGWMAIQAILNICPMDTDSGGGGLLYEMLGVRSYPYSWGPVDRREAIDLPNMAESEIFGSRRLPYKYYGKSFGEDVPRRPSGRAWLRALADGLPDDRPYVQRIFSHAAALVGPNRQDWEDIIVLLKNNPQDFQIIWPDWDENQWKSENSAPSFYKNEFDMTMAEFRNSPPPIEKLMSDRRPIGGVDPRGGPRRPPGGRQRRAPLSQTAARRTAAVSLDQTSLMAVAQAVLARFPQANHDADYGGPPPFLRLSEDRAVSLADGFQALARAIVHWGHEHSLPDSVSIEPVRGPIDYPTYELEQEPKYDSGKTRTGYTARELPQELFPPAEIVQRQGLPMQAGNHLWQAARALVEGDDVLHAAWVALKTIDQKQHIPGSIPVYTLSHNSAGTGLSNAQFTKVHLNAAEFLPAMAQVYLSISRQHPASAAQIPAAFVIGTKITARQRQMLTVPFSPMTKNGGFHIHSLKHEAFVWRENLSTETLDAAWNFVPE